LQKSWFTVATVIADGWMNHSPPVVIFGTGCYIWNRHTVATVECTVATVDDSSFSLEKDESFFLNLGSTASALILQGILT
jgi:hypothetical protein